MTSILGVGDASGDGHADMMTRDRQGRLWRYPGNGVGGFGRAQQIGNGWQTFVEWLRLRPRRYRVIADGVSYDCASAILAKGRFYAGRYVAAPEASLDRASFELVLFERGGRFAVLRCALALALGRLAQTSGVRILRAREITIAGDAADAGGEPVHVDGDVIGTLPVRFTIAPERLNVLVAPRI